MLAHRIPFSAKPSQPIGPLEQVNVDRHSVHLFWNAPADDGGCPLSAFAIEKCDQKYGNWQYAGKADGDVFQYCATNLKEKSEFKFRVAAVNKVGRSEPLESVAALTVKSQFGELRFLLDPIEIYVTFFEFLIM